MLTNRMFAKNANLVQLASQHLFCQFAIKIYANNLFV